MWNFSPKAKLPSWQAAALSLLPTPKAKPNPLSMPEPPAPVEPDERALLASALAALVAPRAAGQLLIAPFQWAERENRRRAQQYESELNRQLRLAQIETERRKAETPILVEQIREAGRAEERKQQAPKVAAEVSKIEAETEATRQRTDQAAQRLPVEIAGRIAALLERAGDEKVGAEERRMMIGYAKYLMHEYGVDLKDFLPAETQASPAQARAAAQAVSEAAQAEQALATAQQRREEAETERQERPLKLEERRARIELITAQALTERMQPELLRARINEIQANIAQGWQGLQLRAQSLANAVRSQNWRQARDTFEGISKSRAFWERQAQELEKAITVEQEIEYYDRNTGQRIRERRRVPNPNAPADLRQRAQEARRLANEYRRLEESALQGLGVRAPQPQRSQPQQRTRTLNVPGVGNVTIEEDI